MRTRPGPWSRTRSSKRLLDLVDPDQRCGELTGVGPLILAGHALPPIVLAQVIQQRSRVTAPESMPLAMMAPRS